jgi:hypothetical protein
MTHLKTISRWTVKRVELQTRSGLKLLREELAALDKLFAYILVSSLSRQIARYLLLLGNRLTSLSISIVLLCYDNGINRQEALRKVVGPNMTQPKVLQISSESLYGLINPWWD